MTHCRNRSDRNVGRPSRPSSPRRAPGSERSPVHRTPADSRGRRGCRLRWPTRLPGASAVFPIPARLGVSLPTVVAQFPRCRGQQRLRWSAINADDDFSRQPSRFRGTAIARVEHSPSAPDWLGEPAALVFATNSPGNVVGADPRRRCGGGP